MYLSSSIILVKCDHGVLCTGLQTAISIVRTKLAERRDTLATILKVLRVQNKVRCTSDNQLNEAKVGNQQYLHKNHLQVGASL
jgi:hypothetical protein